MFEGNSLRQLLQTSDQYLKGIEEKNPFISKTYLEELIIKLYAHYGVCADENLSKRIHVTIDLMEEAKETL
jgi:hypothetical protein